MIKLKKVNVKKPTTNESLMNYISRRYEEVKGEEQVVLADAVVLAGSLYYLSALPTLKERNTIRHNILSRLSQRTNDLRKLFLLLLENKGITLSMIEIKASKGNVNIDLLCEILFIVVYGDFPIILKDSFGTITAIIHEILSEEGNLTNISLAKLSGTKIFEYKKESTIILSDTITNGLTYNSETLLEHISSKHKVIITQPNEAANSLIGEYTTLNCEIGSANNKEEINELLYKNILPEEYVRYLKVMKEWIEEKSEESKLSKRINELLIQIAEDCNKESVMELKECIRRVQNIKVLNEKYKSLLQNHSLFQSYSNSLSIV